MQGKVKLFNKEKGYGFIVMEDGTEAFFHYSQLIMEGFRTIEADTEVSFDLISTERGNQARNVRKM